MSTEEQKYKLHPLFLHMDSSTSRNGKCSLDIGFSRSYVSRFFFTLRLPCIYWSFHSCILLPIIFFSQIFISPLHPWISSLYSYLDLSEEGIFMCSLSVAREAFPLTSSRVELFCFSAPRGSISPFRMFIPSFPSLSIPTSGLLSPLLSRSTSFYGISYVRSSPPKSALWIHPSFCMTKLPSLSLVPPTILWFVLSFLHALPPYSLLPTISQLVSSSSPNTRISSYTLVFLPFSRTKYSRSCFSRTRISRSPPLFAVSSLVRASSFARGCNFRRVASSWCRFLFVSRPFLSGDLGGFQAECFHLASSQASLSFLLLYINALSSSVTFLLHLLKFSLSFSLLPLVVTFHRRRYRWKTNTSERTIIVLFNVINFSIFKKLY